MQGQARQADEQQIGYREPRVGGGTGGVDNPGDGEDDRRDDGKHAHLLPIPRGDNRAADRASWSGGGAGRSHRLYWVACRVNSSAYWPPSASRAACTPCSMTCPSRST